LEVATDPEHKFELALAQNHLDIALDLAREADVDHKWKAVGDAALTAWDIVLATECFENANDLGSLLLIYSSTSNAEDLKKLAEKAEAAGQHNIVLNARWLLGDVDGIIEILTKTDRLAEAVLFSQTYKPSATPSVVGTWTQALEKKKKSRVAKMVGVPGEDDELFPEWDEWLKLESEGGAVEDTNGAAAMQVDAPEAPEEADEEAEEAEEAEEE
jgi:coatomer subunit beta'